MNFIYTARGIFDNEYDADGLSWKKYLEWSLLFHLKELVSLDFMLNEPLVRITGQNDWELSVIDNGFDTYCFKTMDYVIHRVGSIKRYNLLAAIIEPLENYTTYKLDNFDFLGYELLDKDYCTSALTNCGGFDETFLPEDLNQFGLIDEYEKAFLIKQMLKQNNPDEYHADCNVIAIWRHTVLGR